MSHVRKDTYTTGTGEWAKHLRRDGKRQSAKMERVAIKNALKRGGGNEN